MLNQKGFRSNQDDTLKKKYRSPWNESHPKLCVKSEKRTQKNAKGDWLGGRIMPWRLKDTELKQEWPKAVLYQTLLFVSVPCRVLQLCKQKLNQEEKFSSCVFSKEHANTE